MYRSPRSNLEWDIGDIALTRGSLHIWLSMLHIGASMQITRQRREGEPLQSVQCLIRRTSTAACSRRNLNRRWIVSSPANLALLRYARTMRKQRSRNCSKTRTREKREEAFEGDQYGGQYGRGNEKWFEKGRRGGKEMDVESTRFERTRRVCSHLHSRDRSY